MPRTLVSGVDNVLEVAVEADRGREPCTTAREVNKRSKELGYLPQRGNIGQVTLTSGTGSEAPSVCRDGGVIVR